MLKKRLFILMSLSASVFALGQPARAETRPTGESLIFIHPDGAGLAAWNIYRIARLGPDHFSEWDVLPGVAVYRGHMKNHLNASSHGGGTTHAYGVKVQKNSFGQDGLEKINGASGFPGSIMMEAQAAGLNVGIINSGHLAEPGTAAMLAQVDARAMAEEIAAQLITSGAALILGGGEVFFLPEGTIGQHGQPGIRADGRNLVEEARAAGYTVIYTLEELDSISADDARILGLFAARDTYNAQPEEELAAQNLPHYWPDAPSVADMTDAALQWLSAQPKPFFLMVEEEGTDNFANTMNAAGMIEATARADAAIGVASHYVDALPGLSLLVAADSEASGPDMIDFGVYDSEERIAETPLPPTNDKGAPMDGSTGTGTLPFISATDRFGQKHLFALTWTGGGDYYGGVLVRAGGPLAQRLPPNVDNTEIYSLIRETLLED